MFQERNTEHVYNVAIGAAFNIVCMNPGVDEGWVAC